MFQGLHGMSNGAYFSLSSPQNSCGSSSESFWLSSACGRYMMMSFICITDVWQSHKQLKAGC